MLIKVKLELILNSIRVRVQIFLAAYVCFEPVVSEVHFLKEWLIFTGKIDDSHDNLGVLTLPDSVRRVNSSADSWNEKHVDLFFYGSQHVSNRKRDSCKQEVEEQRGYLERLFVLNVLYGLKTRLNILLYNKNRFIDMFSSHSYTFFLIKPQIPVENKTKKQTSICSGIVLFRHWNWLWKQKQKHYVAPVKNIMQQSIWSFFLFLWKKYYFKGFPLAESSAGILVFGAFSPPTLSRGEY